MTWLDAVCFVLLLLVGLGGYEQGAIRGILRLVGLLAGGGLGFLLVLRVGTLDTVQGAAASAIIAILLGVTATGLLIWSVTRMLPSFVHRNPANRALGILPALVVGLLILTLALGLAERLVTTQERQAFIRAGKLTGPLVRVVDLVEQTVAGVR